MSDEPSLKLWVSLYLLDGLPLLIGWFFALYFCVKRRRENPRGAVLLGVAVLLQLTIFGGTFLSYFIRHEMENSIFWSNLREIFIGSTRYLAMICWILVAFAVFPGHRNHREFHTEIADDSTCDGTGVAGGAQNRG